MSILSSQGNPLEFKHAELRRLNRDQKKAFQTALAKLVSHHNRCAPVEAAERKLSNDQIRKEMQSLLTHLNHVCEASGPESKLQGYYWEQYVGWKANDDERKVIADFPKMAQLMRKIVADSISSKSYKIIPRAKDLPPWSLGNIAMQAAQLLMRFEIEPTTTADGVWCVLTKYISYHGRGRDEGTYNICNYLKKVKGYF